VATMVSKLATKEDWAELCQQASVEEDPEKLMQLINEINRLTNGGPDEAAQDGRR